MERSKGYFIKQSFSNDFVDYMEELYKKYGEEIFEIQGIANKYMDIAQFSRSFFGNSTNVADVSVDANANVKEKNVTQYTFESNKSVMRLNSLYMMYKKIKEIYDIDSAKLALEKVINGEVFVNDLHTYASMPYCFAFDLRNLITNGMNFYHGNMNIGAPKRSDSFIALLIQSTAYISNQIAGAASYPDFFPILDWYYRAEMGEDYMTKVRQEKDNSEGSRETWNRVKNQFQNLIYSFNFPFRGGQSLKYSEKIIVDNKTISIGDFVESNLDEDIFENQLSEDRFTYSLNTKSGGFEKKKITAVIKHKMADDHLIHYSLATGQTFEGTEQHALFTRKGLDIIETTSASEIDNLIVPFNFCKKEKVSTLDVGHFGAQLPIRKLMLTPEIMYMFGQYIGDGSICGSRLTVSTYNKDVAEFISQSIGNFFKTHINSHDCVEISIGKDVAGTMVEILGSGSHEKRIPREWYDEENILYLLGGYIDADGHLRKNKGDICISSVNEDLLKDVQFILLSRGILSKISGREREGFGKISQIFELTIPAIESVKMEKYIHLKKPEVKIRLDYTRQIIDFDGIVQEIRDKYFIRGLAEAGIISTRSSDKSLSMSDFDSIIAFLENCIASGNGMSDEEFMDRTLCPKYRNGVYNRQYIISKEDRIAELSMCLSKMKVFHEALPVRVEDISEIESEEYVYDISVEDNENFLTANNIYAHNSAFTNLSIMDHGFMDSLFAGYQFPDFTNPDINSSIELSKTFFEYFTDINCKEGIFTFPVTTIAISLDDKGEYIDPDFVDWSAEINSKKALGNIFQDKPTSFSSCCFSGDQKCITKSSNGVNFTSFKDLKQLTWKENKNNFKIFHNGSWVRGREVEIPRNNKQMYKVITSNNKKIIVTEDHLNPTIDGDKTTSSLSVNDFLLFNTNTLDTCPEQDGSLTYEQGFTVGAFLGDGSYGSRIKLANGTTHIYDTNYSLNENCWMFIKEKIDIANKQLGGNGESKLSAVYNNVYPLRISSRNLTEFIQKWVIGDRYDNKDLNPNCLLQSIEFRKGILDGWYNTDGGNSNRCYTTSKSLVDSIEMLITSLGMISIINISDRTDEKVIIRNKVYNRNLPLYCVRWYSPKNKRGMKDVYIFRNNSIYFKIKSIEKIEFTDDNVYCFEMENNNEPYFTLPNGIITHNCRLKNDFSKIAEVGYQNSFGVGGLSIGCYDDKTEVMTEKGFMLFKDVIEQYPNKDIKILTVNSENNTLEYSHPTEYMQANYSGEMHHYKHDSIDLLVTPNHNMFVESRKTGEKKLIKSEDLKSGYRIPKLFATNIDQDLEFITIEGVQYDADAFFKLVGLYLGDGATYHNIDEAKYRAYEISFQVKKPREIESIEKTLDKLNIKYNKNYISTRDSWNIRFYSKAFWNIVQPLGKCLEKSIPEFLLNDGGFSNLTNLLQGLLDTDGTSGTNGIWYYTSSAKLKNSVEILLSKLGIPFRTQQRLRKPSFLNRDKRWITPNAISYEIKLSTKEKYIERPSKYKNIENYNGKIYCMEVPNHTLLVRREGKTSVWCGNSHRVAGINLPRISMLEKDNPNVMEEDLELSHKILYAHRELMRERIAGGYLPLYTYNWIDLNRQYSTIGFVGGYEYVANKGFAIETDKGVKLLQNTLMKIEKKVVEWQTNEKEEKNIYNIEQIPAESMAVRLADMDYVLGYNREETTKENAGTVVNKKFNLYSNQYIPLVSNASIYDRFKVQGQFDSLTSGGAILHINVDDEKPISKDQFKKLMDAARKLKTVYYAINYAYSECANGHYVIGKHDTCEVCRAKITQQFTRVVGFITPVKSWNSTRRTVEYPNRIFYHNGALDIDKELKMTTAAALPELPAPSINRLGAVASVCC